MSYTKNFKSIESYVQQKIKAEFCFNNKPFYYIVPMFPYPSGNIHMGHIRNYTLSSVYAAYKKSKGYNVLHAIGFDSFGLPAETAAIKHHVAPKTWTESNIETMMGDFSSMGFNFDRTHTVKTHEFSYYKFEQDIFKQAYKSGLVYKKEQFVNYDPVDKTILSNEQVKNGKGWRSGADVVRKKMPMYFFNIRKYAIELDSMLSQLDWPSKVIEMQRHWIGIQNGHDITFQFTEGMVAVFRKSNMADINTVVMGINHPFIKNIESGASFQEWLEISSQGSVSQKNNIGMKNYYITKYSVCYEGRTVPIVIDINREEECIFTSDTVPDSGQTTIGNYIEIKPATYIGLKDWCISRQRYWGNPIPMINCNVCGDIASPDYIELPVDLKPNGSGNVLKQSQDFENCTCPQCGNSATRVTDTMDTFVQSSWYYHRYINPQSKDMIPKADTQVDLYIGGVEHATMHLIYTRFFHKMLRDFGMVTTDEPIKKLITQGMVCKKYQNSEGKTVSAKMSKSIGNVVAPKEYIDQYGADAVQMFTVFAAPPGDNFDFESSGMVGTFRFLDEVYRYFFEENKAVKNVVESKTIQTMRKLMDYVEREFEGRGNLNTIIPQIMVAFKEMKRTNFINSSVKESVERDFISQLAIFAPHLSEYITDHVLNK